MIEGFHLLFHESGLAPLFHPLSASFSQKNHFFGVFQVCPGVSLWSEYAPGTALEVGKKDFGGNPPKNFTATFCDLFRWGFSLIFTQPAWKHYIYYPPSPPSNQTTPHTPPHHRIVMWYQINDILSFILCDFVTLNTIFLFSMLLLKGFSTWPNSSGLHCTQNQYLKSLSCKTSRPCSPVRSCHERLK